jgi:hypothetical protein
VEDTEGAARVMYRSVSYGFPEAAIEPGEERTAKIEAKGVFRAQRLFMHGTMDDVRGAFWIKRSRLPRLDRKCIVVAYSKVTPRRYGKKKVIRFTKGKTVVQYADADRRFTREYLPSSVVYEPVDPLSYIRLRNVFINTEPQMPAYGGDVAAQLFGQHSGLVNGLPFAPATAPTITLVLKNEGDIQVRVRAALFGWG